MPKPTINFNNSYAQLGDTFSSKQLPAKVAKPQLIRINDDLADFLAIDISTLNSEFGISALAGNQLFAGSEPIATVYAGHQFGHWNPQLGDGRAILLGEVIATNKQRYDIQLKGAGRTPYSRGGDGLSPLGPVLREYILSEAMAALGVPTTRSLAAVTTGEQAFREQALPAAVLTRVASSHIRIGTFQFFSAKGDNNAVKQLSDHVIARHFPEALTSANPYLSLLENVIERQAQLVSQWQSFGFIHGVMNTDNMLICGETVDYGPCAFIDNYQANALFSSIDQQGRYAYKNQPSIAQWDLAWLAQALIPLLHDDEAQGLTLAQQAIESFGGEYDHFYNERMAHKLGLQQASEKSQVLTRELLELMEKEQCDFTLTFRQLSDSIQTSNDRATVENLITLPPIFNDWIERWKQALSSQSLSAGESQTLMYRNNPAIIARNHLVEEAIEQATHHNDYSFFNTLVDALATPYHYDKSLEKYATPPTEEQRVTATFCGT